MGSTHPTTKRVNSFLHKLKSILKHIRSITKKNTRPRASATGIQSQLKQVFKFMDLNGDGKISPFELKQLMLSLGHEEPTALREAEGMIREVDVNGDGFVDMEEFMQAVGDSSMEDLKEAFLVFDEDRNGLISAKELRRVLAGLGLGKWSVRECRVMIRKFDRNGDGMIDFDEFREFMMP